MTHLRLRPARVYTVASAAHDSAADPSAHPSLIHCLEDALAQLGARVYVVDRELRIVQLSPPQGLDLFAPRAAQFGGATLEARIVDCVVGEQRAVLESACMAVVSGQLAQASCELDLPADQTRRVRLVITPAYSAQGSVAGATLTAWELAPAAAPTAEVAADRVRRGALLRVLNAIGTRLTTELDDHAIVQLVTETLVAELGLAFARIWLVDLPSATLVLRSSAGLSAEAVGALSHVPLGQRLTGQICASHQPLMTNDLLHMLDPDDRSWATALGIRGFAGYPLLGRDQLIGVVDFFSYTPLDEDLLAALESLAHQVALALERAQLTAAQRSARDDARAQAAMATTRAAQLSATLAAMADGVWTCDETGRLLMVNAAALEMFGLDSTALQLETLADIVELFAPETPQRELCLGLPAALEGRTLRRELMLITARPDSALLTVMVTATPMRDTIGQVIGAVAVVHNVTQQKVMERLKDDFLSVAAHELKTPVTAIKGYAQLALMRLKPTDESGPLQRALTTIDQQAQRIAHLVNELVDASRIQSGHLELRHEPIDLVARVLRVMEQAQSQALQHRLTLSAPESLVLQADALRIEQVIQNLLENAIKYSPDGGLIQVSIGVERDMAYVVVTDHGVGIPRDKQAHVFDAWFQAHGDTIGDFGGMGLGLNICKEIVERHGGQIWVESNQQQGSRFGFTLPLARSAETAA